MTNLSTYNSIKEIEKYFHVDKIINTKTELDNFIEIHTQVDDKFIYRGANNGSWKIYASSQREYLTKGLVNKFGSYTKFLEALYKQSAISHNGILTSIYDATRQDLHYLQGNVSQGTKSIPYNSLWAFSFLQHYGAPTPLIDFSGNFKGALFFAWHGAEHVTNSFLLSDYIQINYFDKNTVTTQYNKGFRSIMNYCIDETDNTAPSNINNALTTFTNYFDYFSKPQSNEIFYLDRNGSTHTLINPSLHIDINFNVMNLNIIAQEGLFIINYSETDSIEEQWTIQGLNLTKISKTLIHKSLINEVYNQLLPVPASSVAEYYYPMEETLARGVYKTICM